jgi:predicted nucleic acid-binding protein
MILADTSIWIDHFRSGSGLLAARLERQEILIHPFILGELMLGGLGTRKDVIGDLRALPHVAVATPEEVETLIEGTPLYGRGIGYVDAALLASARLHGAARLWTKDRRLALVAVDMAVGFTAA